MLKGTPVPSIDERASEGKEVGWMLRKRIIIADEEQTCQEDAGYKREGVVINVLSTGYRVLLRLID